MSDLVERLERELHADAHAPLTADRLRAIRHDGRRRRARGRAAVVAGAALAVVLTGGIPVLVSGGQGSPAPAPTQPAPSGVEDPARGPEVRASPDLPPDLAALQERILADVPGAVRSSPTQVDLPDPRVADPDLRPPASGYPDPGGRVVGLGVVRHVGPQDFVPGAFPRWLSRGWEAFQDRAADADEPGLRRLATTAVRVAAGEWRLGCDPGTSGRSCRPVLLSRNSITTVLGPPVGRGDTWLGDLGADDVRVLEPTSDAEGDAPTLVVAGVARDDVTSVEFVSSTGERVEGRVDTRLAPGTSILWAAVPGDVEQVLVDDRDR